MLSSTICVSEHRLPNKYLAKSAPKYRGIQKCSQSSHNQRISLCQHHGGKQFFRRNPRTKRARGLQTISGSTCQEQRINKAFIRKANKKVIKTRVLWKTDGRTGDTKRYMGGSRVGGCLNASDISLNVSS